MASVREPAVAGRFYSADPESLRDELRGYLDRVDFARRSPPRAVIVPHAGTPYSGPIAAHGHARLIPLRERVRDILLVGPAHFVPLDGMAVPGVERLRTPLGDVPVATELRERALTLRGVAVDDAAHAPEHSLEVQLPFLQLVLPGIPVLPVAVGDAHPAHARDLIEELWGEDTVVVVSTDLSHYLDYEGCVETDRETARAICDLSPERIGSRRACGGAGLRALLVVARRRGYTVELLDLRNSGDTAGPRDQVVGYGAFAVV